MCVCVCVCVWLEWMGAGGGEEEGLIIPLISPILLSHLFARTSLLLDPFPGVLTSLS